MSQAERVILAYALACAGLDRQGPVPEPEAAELRQRLRARMGLMPWWAFLLAAAAAFAIRWFLPMAVLGRPARFDRLPPERAALLLEKLQLVTSIAVRGPFVILKSLVLPAVYGSSARLAAMAAPVPAQAVPEAAETAPARRNAAPGKRWDVVVAGSGAGGAALAGRLAQGGAKVLLLEKGPAPRHHADAGEAVLRYYTAAGFVGALGRSMIPVPTGTGLGGTTAVNSGTCMRTPPELLARWEESGAGSFTKAGFEAKLDEAWRCLKVKTAPPHTLSRPSRLVQAGLKALGLPPAKPLDRCEDGCEGAGRCCFICPTRAKVTSDRAFLADRQDSGPCLRTLSELAEVRPPGKEGGTVSLKVRDLRTGVTETVETPELVLAAGALATPYFVRRFKLGDAWRQAGEGLSLHPASKVFGIFPEPVEGWKGVPQGLGFDDPADPRVRYEGVYTPPEMAAVTMPLEGSRLGWWMRRYRYAATFGFMIRDEARGRVRHPLGPSIPLLSYDLSPADLSRMASAVRLVARILFAAGAERVLLPVNSPGNELENPSQLEGGCLSGLEASRLYSMAFHPLGTCAMGRVVDEDLRLAPGIHVCDGSVVPESLGVNPQVTIYAFALRLAERMLGKDRSCAT
ncbi:MAG: GMC family oxidoreductase [Elusimicrobia bacterium]|nr:GMC family oxidoreductase [Elusimicrobiota bacterium]